MKNPYNPVTEPASFKWFEEKLIPEKPKDFKAQLTLNIIGVEDDSGGVTVWLESHPYIVEQAETKELAIEKLRDIVDRELMNF